MFQKKALTVCLFSSVLFMTGQGFAQEAEAPTAGDADIHTERISAIQGMNTSYSDPTKRDENARRNNAQRTHQVVAGDTLWDLSATYMADPFKWPALWSFNPQVTNPHWIYPGDTIYLAPQNEEITVVPEEVRPRQSLLTKAQGNGIIFVPGYYVSELPETRGHILFSDQEKNLLTTHDEVQVDWVDIEMRKKFNIGQQFTIFEQSRPVLNEDGDPMAYKLIRAGSLQLLDVQKDALSTAIITDANHEIERGYLIIPNEDLMFKVHRTSNAKSMEGRIIDTIDINDELAAEQYVIINRGAEDGVSAGNRWFVFEQREGLDRLPQGQGVYEEDDNDKDPRNGKVKRPESRGWVLGHEPEIPTWPRREDIDEAYEDREYTTDDLPLRKIGEILVIDAKDKFCTGIITTSIRDIPIDAHVVMLRGM